MSGHATSPALDDNGDSFADDVVLEEGELGTIEDNTQEVLTNLTYVCVYLMSDTYEWSYLRICPRNFFSRFDANLLSPAKLQTE